MKRNKVQNSTNIRVPFFRGFLMVFCLAGMAIPYQGKAQSLLVESLTGPITRAETDAFKIYMQQKVSVPSYNGGNVWVYGNNGKAIEACGLMYEATKDTAILDRMIYYCDAALAGRNDLASAANGGQLVTWTGNIDPVWPSSRAGVTPAGAGVEQGQVLSHITYCAKLILETPSIWDMNVAIGDPEGFGATYKARALKYIKEGDYVIDNWILPRFIRSSESNHYYFPGSRNTYKPNEPVPWNQAWMLTNGLVRLVLCHIILGDDHSRVARYDGIVKPNIDWFFASLHPKTSVAGTSCRTWAYALPKGMEDTNHAAYDSEGLWIAYSSGRYGIKLSDMLPFANTYFDVVLATVTNGLFAGRVDGTTGTGHAGGDNYVRDEYIYLTEFRPEKYETIGNIEISTNKVSSSPQITGRLLWEKNRRWERSSTSVNVAPKARRGTSPGVSGAHLDYTPAKAPKSWSKAMAETVMARYPDYRTAYWKDWSYVQGYMFCGFEMLYHSTGEKKYMEYIKQYIDHFVDENGNYTGDKLTNLDNLMTGTSIVAMYQYTGDERYKKAAMQFRKVFDTYPRSDGQFWHGNKSPNMWIDGIFMGQMFLIRYGNVIGDADYAYSEAVRQITVFAKHCKKGNSGLYLHAWTEKPRDTKWADTITGLSPEVWSEGLGWYSLIVPELLAVMPKDHPKRAEVEDIYTRMMAGLKNTQDPKTGGWYMIVDKGDQPGNWIDPSGTAMFVYSTQRGIDLGLLDKKIYEPVAKRGYQSLSQFVKVNDSGLVDVSGGGDGITIKKDYATYINVSRVLNAKEAVAGFLWASAIMEE